MASFADLKDLVKVALGTPETVNFKALYSLLTGIIQRLAGLYGKGRADKVPPLDDDSGVLTPPSVISKPSKKTLQASAKARRKSDGGVLIRADSTQHSSTNIGTAGELAGERIIIS